MSTLNPYLSSEYLTQGSSGEQNLLDDLTEEYIKAWGQHFLYIPRTLVALDDILGEDRLSIFENSFPIEMFVDTPTGFNGQGEFIAKFGLYIEQSMQISVSRRRWREVIGSSGLTVLPTRPAEGDLLYYPVTKRLFEIKYTEKETFFFQLGSLQTFKLTVELFQYASERINTGDETIDAFEALKTFDVTQNEVETPDSFGDNNHFDADAANISFDKNNPFGE